LVAALAADGIRGVAASSRLFQDIEDWGGLLDLIATVPYDKKSRMEGFEQ
jgi:hypothetical protein